MNCGKIKCYLIKLKQSYPNHNDLQLKHRHVYYLYKNEFEVGLYHDDWQLLGIGKEERPKNVALNEWTIGVTFFVDKFF